MDNDRSEGFRCTHCGSDEVCTSRVRSAFWHDERLVVVDDIPAIVCASCGEQYYDDGTAIGLDLLRGAGFRESDARSVMTVPVFSFTDLAPFTGR